MCIDILDYVLYIPKEQYELLQKMHLLDWLLHKCCSNNVLFELWRGELFSMWFLLDQQRTYQIELGMHFVTYMLHYNPSLADALLSSLLRNRHHPSHSLQLKHLINQGHESGLLKLKDESTLAKVSPHVREELNKLLYEKIEPSDTEIEYSPFGILMQEANHN